MTLLARRTQSGMIHSVLLEWNMRYIFIGGFLSETAAKLAAERLACTLGRHILWRNT